MSATEEAAPLLDNPLRNGALLSALAHALLHGAPRNFWKAPATIAAARHALRCALIALTAVAPASLWVSQEPLSGESSSTALEVTAEQVLRGKKRAIWGILNQLRIAHARQQRSSGTF